MFLQVDVDSIEQLADKLTPSVVQQHQFVSLTAPHTATHAATHTATPCRTWEGVISRHEYEYVMSHMYIWAAYLAQSRHMGHWTSWHSQTCLRVTWHESNRTLFHSWHSQTYLRVTLHETVSLMVMSLRVDVFESYITWRIWELDYVRRIWELYSMKFRHESL